jgi:hypothetical protein
MVAVVIWGEQLCREGWTVRRMANDVVLRRAAELSALCNPQESTPE